MKKLASALFLLLAVAANLFAQVGPTSGGGGSVASGTAIGSCTSSILYTNASTLLGCNPAAVVNGSVSTAGRSILTIRDTITGASTTSNFLNITGSMPSTLSANSAAVLIDTTVDNDAFIQYGIRSAPSGTGPGSGAVVGVGGDNSETSSGYSYGTRGTVSGAVSTAIGATGLVYGGTNRIGGYFALANQNPPATSGALIVDNVAQAVNIFEARDNGTAVFTIADGGQMRALAGSATAPGMSFIAETGTGLYQATNRMNAAVAQGDHWSFNASGSVSELQLGNATHFSWSSTDPPTAADGDTGLQRVAAGVVGATSGASLGSPGWVQNSAGEVSLNADYTNATATFSNTALSVTVISGRTYNFSLNLTFADSTAADGAQFDFNGGSAAATNFRVHCMSTNAAGAILAQSNAASTALATANSVTLALTTQANLVCNGTFVPSGNGTFIVRAAQAAHSTGTLTVHRGSWLSVKDARPL